MLRKLFLIGFVFFLPFTGNSGKEEWGFYAHRRINHFAVFTLPPELFGFYKEHIEYITESAVNPDKRRYAVKGEAQRHYIDIDHYAVNGGNPFEVVPRKWEAAVAKFTEDTLQAYGIIPWHIEVMMKRLTRAFQEKDQDRILRLSADLGHYIGDAHVPLHTTKNYNGQYTDQYGIHAFWESRLPELYDHTYNFLVGNATYVDDVLAYAWDIVEESHNAVDSVLSFEKELSKRFPADKRYGFEERGRTLSRVFSQEYSKAYHDMLGGMVERRMRQTMRAVGSLWFTAWVNAGQPNMGKVEYQHDEDYEEEWRKIEKKFQSAEEAIGRDCN